LADATKPVGRGLQRSLGALCSRFPRESTLSDWGLRVQDFRVFYDVLVEGDVRLIKIKAVGHKEHGVLRIGDREVQ
jgi:hypothetical protein